MLGPSDRFLARLAQNPGADRHDQAGIFCKRDELARADKAVLLALPADQRLEADDLLADRIDNRLEVEQQLVLLDRLAEREFELAALLGIGVWSYFQSSDQRTPIASIVADRQEVVLLL